MADSEEKGDRNILASCLEDTRKLIGVKNFVILTGQHAKRLPNRTNVCLVVALRPEVLLESEGILRREKGFVFLSKRELGHREIVERVHSEPVEQGDRNDPRNPHGDPPAAARMRNVAASWLMKGESRR